MTTAEFKAPNSLGAETPTSTDQQALPQPKRPMSAITWNLMLVVGVLIYSSYTILVHLCEVNGKIPFSSASMVFITELTKLSMSIGMLWSSSPEWRPCRQRNEAALPVSITGDSSSRPRLLSLATVLPFAVPAFLYCFNNNLAVYIQLQVDPATYQVLGNLKVLTTAFLFRLIIKRPIEKLQWFALSLLVCAGVFNSFGGLASKGKLGADTKSAAVLHITLQGLFMIITYCTISGLAGVYTEYVLKKQKEMSLHLQNSLLYIYGLVLNFITFAWQAHADGLGIFNLFHGYTVYTWLIILTQACGGIIMGAIMKYATNITRLFLISAAMVVTTLASMAIFGLKLNLYFVISMMLVMVALGLYHHKPSS